MMATTNPPAPMAVPAGPASDFFGASIQSIAETAQMGELFQYTVGNVSLARLNHVEMFETVVKRVPGGR